MFHNLNCSNTASEWSHVATDGWVLLADEESAIPPPSD